MTFRDQSGRLLEELGAEVMRADLAPIQDWLTVLGNPQKDLPTVLVAGTNGKGATATSLAAILSHCGYRTGLFTSPHLESVRERVRLDGRSVSDTLLLATLEEILPQAPAPPTYFEAITVAAIVLFRRFRVDLAVVEVGLGGRLDASNCLEPMLSLITPISLDHQAILGGSLTAITREKAGILRPNRPAVMAREPKASYDVLQLRCEALGIPATFLSSADLEVRSTDFGQTFRLPSTSGPTYQMTLQGPHQAFSAALARTAAGILREKGFRRVKEVGISRALRSLQWPGRLETIRISHQTVLLDGAHNLAGAVALKEALETRGPHDLLLGFLRDKPALSMVETLAPHAQRIVLTTPPSPRSWSPSDAAVPPDPIITVVPDLDEALDHALRGPSPLLVVAGSLHLVGAVRKRLHQRFGVPTPAAETAVF